jgi:hypothetical protein
VQLAEAEQLAEVGAVRPVELALLAGAVSIGTDALSARRKRGLRTDRT